MCMGERIKELRLNKKMTQTELGAVIGVGKAAIQKYEKGIVKNLKRSSIQQLANALGCKPSYLLGFDMESTPEITESEKNMLLKFRELDAADQKYIEGLINRFHESIGAVVVKEKDNHAN